MSLYVVHSEVHDLPVSWDEHRVEWTPWELVPITHIPVDPCERCGSTEPRPFSGGSILPNEGETFTVGRTVTAKRSGRKYEREDKVVPAWPILCLAAFRCPACQLDTVYEDYRHDRKRYSRAWTLEESDYGPNGSRERPT